jgi:hypothetical protein
MEIDLTDENRKHKRTVPVSLRRTVYAYCTPAVWYAQSSTFPFARWVCSQRRPTCASRCISIQYPVSRSRPLPHAHTTLAQHPNLMKEIWISKLKSPGLEYDRKKNSELTEYPTPPLLLVAAAAPVASSISVSASFGYHLQLCAYGADTVWPYDQSSRKAAGSA